MKTQWRVVCRPTGHLMYLGLDYGAMRTVERSLKVRLDEDGLGQLHVMETTAADILND